MKYKNIITFGIIASVFAVTACSSKTGSNMANRANQAINGTGYDNTSTTTPYGYTTSDTNSANRITNNTGRFAVPNRTTNSALNNAANSTMNGTGSTSPYTTNGSMGMNSRYSTSAVMPGNNLNTTNTMSGTGTGLTGTGTMTGTGTGMTTTR